MAQHSQQRRHTDAGSQKRCGPAFRGIDDEAAIRSPRLDDVALLQAICRNEETAPSRFTLRR